MELLSYQGLIQRLRELDEEASLRFGLAERLSLIIVGGSALVLMEYIARGTHDIDAMEASRQLEDLLADYDINMNVQTYINNFPYNYLDRVKPLPFKGKIIDFYTASLEDIVVAKLYSYRDKDYEDVCSPRVLQAIDWERLHFLATSDDEAKASALNEYRYREFLSRFEEYERRYRPCGN